MVLVKKLLKNVAITINVLLEINPVKRTLNCLIIEELKEKDFNCFINWSRKCDLYICEKLLIPTANPNVLLNKRDELVSKCRHGNKFTLKCFKDR